MVGIALVTGSFIASGPAVAAAAAAGHRPTRPAELRTLRTLRTPQPSEAPHRHEARPLDDAGALRR